MNVRGTIDDVCRNTVFFIFLSFSPFRLPSHARFGASIRVEERSGVSLFPPDNSRFFLFHFLVEVFARGQKWGDDISFAENVNRRMNLSLFFLPLFSKIAFLRRRGLFFVPSGLFRGNPRRKDARGR